MVTIPGRIPGRERWEVEDKLILSNPTDKTGELKIYGGTAGEKAMSVWYGTDLIFSIQALSTTVILLGGSSTPIQIGSGVSTSHSLNSYNDLFIVGKLEVDGVLYSDGMIHVGGGVEFYDNQKLYFGSGPDSIVVWSTYQTTENTLICGLSDDSKSVVFTISSFFGKDFDHAAQSNPTLFVHSATDPDTANDEWISICHDVTDGVIDVGSGTLNLGGSTVNFVNTTRTASTVTHDAYATLEIGGTEYKFMLGS